MCFKVPPKRVKCIRWTDWVRNGILVRKGIPKVLTFRTLVRKGIPKVLKVSCTCWIPHKVTHLCTDHALWCLVFEPQKQISMLVRVFSQRIVVGQSNHLSKHLHSGSTDNITIGHAEHSRQIVFNLIYFFNFLKFFSLLFCHSSAQQIHLKLLVFHKS